MITLITKKFVDLTNNPLGFKDDASGTLASDTEDDYKYDANGNMIKDQNKHIDLIKYNHLNLPIQINFDTGNSISYVYDAAGTKLKKQVHEGSTITRTDFVSGYQYKDNVLQFFPTAEGYVNKEATGYKYVYNYTDHLGNIRLSYADNDGNGSISTNEILEENNYYAFGLKHNGYNNATSANDAYKYKYQGQERQNELNLNWDSFKWRNYDYAIGRFMSVDPLTEKYNTWAPYVFSGNRVSDARELEGLEPHTIHKTLDKAVINFGEQYNGLSIREKKEIGTSLYSSIDENGDVYYSYTDSITSDLSFAVSKDYEAMPDGAVKLGDAHTHSNDLNTEIEGTTEGSNFPSHQDMSGAMKEAIKNKTTVIMYVVAPNGSILKFNTDDGKKVKRYDSAVKQVNNAKNSVPSDPNSNTRKNEIGIDFTPKVLPKVKDLKLDDDENK